MSPRKAHFQHRRTTAETGSSKRTGMACQKLGGLPGESLMPANSESEPRPSSNCRFGTMRRPEPESGPSAPFYKPPDLPGSL